MASADPHAQRARRRSARSRCGSATAAARRSPTAASRAAREVDVGAAAPRAGAGARKSCARRNGSRRCSAAASRLDACETLLLRARADLDAGRDREAALQLRVGLEALLVELKEALADPGHEEDMATLSERRSEAGEAANAALQGDLTREQARAGARAAGDLRAGPAPPPRPARLAH